MITHVYVDVIFPFVSHSSFQKKYLTGSSAMTTLTWFFSPKVSVNFHICWLFSPRSTPGSSGLTPPRRPRTRRRCPLSSHPPRSRVAVERLTISINWDSTNDFVGMLGIYWRHTSFV